MVRAVPVTVGALALTLLSIGVGSAQTTGVAACDDFLKNYEACITSKMPEAQKATFKGQLEQMRKSWSDMAKTSAKATLESACKQSAEQTKAALSSIGCSF
jgi:hypothetical protein